MPKLHSHVFILAITISLLFLGTKPLKHMKKEGSLDYPSNSITKFAYYAKPKLVILSPEKISEYQIGKEKFSKTAEVDHNIPNLKENYVKAKMDRSGKIFIAFNTTLFSFDANLNYKQIGNYTKEKFTPDVKEHFVNFTKVIDFNDYESFMSLMTNKSESYLFEMKYFREKIITYQISTEPRTKNGTIHYMSYVKYGRRLATFYEDKTLVLYRTKTKEATGKQAIVSDYKFDEMPLNIGQCDEVELFAVLMKQEVLFFDVRTSKMVKSYKFKDEDVKDNGLISCRSPSGTKVLLIFSPKKVFFLDLTSLQMITIEEIDAASPSKWLYYLSGTDHFLTEEPISGNDESTRYTSYEFDMKDSRFCHKTCGPNCKVNFQPCSIFSKLFKYLLWIVGVIIVSIVLFFVYSFARNSYKNRHNSHLGDDGRSYGTSMFKIEFFTDYDHDDDLDYDSDEKKDDDELVKDDDYVEIGDGKKVDHFGIGDDERQRSSTHGSMNNKLSKDNK